MSIKDHSINGIYLLHSSLTAFIETNNSIIRKTSSITPLEEQLSIFQHNTKSDIDFKFDNSNKKETIAQELDILNTKISESLPVNNLLPPTNSNLNLPNICEIQTEKRIPELTEDNEAINDVKIDLTKDKRESITSEDKPTQFIIKDPVVSIDQSFKAPPMFGNSLDVKFVHK